MFRVLLLCLLLIAVSLRARHQSLSLQAALNARLVQVRGTSLGGHTGYCMRLSVKNLGKDSLIVDIEPGRRLNSLEDRNQDILIVKAERMALRVAEEKVVNVRGYCCQSNRCSPKDQAAYAANVLADSSLVMLATFLNANVFDESAEQQAVWAISDHLPVASIPDYAATLPLIKFVAALRREPMPLYNVVTSTHVYSNGLIAVAPQVLKITLTYAVSKDSYGTLRILDNKGLPVCFVRSEWLMATPQKDYALEIPVRGLQSGKYTIELTTSDQLLATKEFEL